MSSDARTLVNRPGDGGGSLERRAVGEDAQTLLRSLVSTVEREVARTPGADLASAWRRLVDHLALGPEPERRECPACGHSIMRKATLCGHCWTRSSAA